MLSYGGSSSQASAPRVFGPSDFRMRMKKEKEMTGAEARYGRSTNKKQVQIQMPEHHGSQPSSKSNSVNALTKKQLNFDYSKEIKRSIESELDE